MLFPDGHRLVISGQGYNSDGEVTHENGEPVTSAEKAQLNKLGRNVVLCIESTLENKNDIWKHSGDAMDIALLSLTYKLDLNPAKIRSEFEKLFEIPFESEKRYVATLNRINPEEAVLVMKGATETVVQYCTHMSALDGPKKIDGETINKKALGLAEEGYRVLAFASKTIGNDEIPAELGESV